MPIVLPPSLQALGLIPFNINPHYVDPDSTSTHRGETREERIREYLGVVKDTPVVGLREGSWLLVEGERIQLGGLADRSAKLFVAQEPAARVFEIGSDLSFLLRR